MSYYEEEDSATDYSDVDDAEEGQTRPTGLAGSGPSKYRRTDDAGSSVPSSVEPGTTVATVRNEDEAAISEQPRERKEEDALRRQLQSRLKSLEASLDSVSLAAGHGAVGAEPRRWNLGAKDGPRSSSSSKTKSDDKGAERGAGPAKGGAPLPPRFNEPEKEKKGKKKKKEFMFEGPDELYGEELDDEDAAWVARELRAGVSKAETKPEASDAVLSCPCCFSIVCMDCQMHERYFNQWRAVFAINCHVGGRPSAQARDGERKGATKRKKEDESTETQSAEDGVRRVSCGECGTEVGVLDEEEVYHFFNVLPTHS